MLKLKKRFEGLAMSYREHRYDIGEHLHYLQQKHKTKEAGDYKNLVDQADALLRGLEAVFADTGRQLETASIKMQLHEFKKITKALYEMKKPVWRQWIEAIIIAGSLAFFLKTFVFGTYHVPTGSAEPTILVGDRVWANKLAYFRGTIKRGDYIVLDDVQFVYNQSGFINYMWQRYIGIPIPILGLSSGPINITKRVIAMPGDWIEGREENGKAVFYLNDKPLHEPYLNPYPLVWARRSTGITDFGFLQYLPVINWLQYRVARVPVSYTYDPTKSWDEQLFYRIYPHEFVLNPRTQEKIFKQPYLAESCDVIPRMQLPAGKYWVMGDNRKGSGDSRMFGFADESLIHGRISFVMWSVDSDESLWLFEFIKHPIEFFTKRIRWARFFKPVTNPLLENSTDTIKA